MRVRRSADTTCAMRRPLALLAVPALALALAAAATAGTTTDTAAWAKPQIKAVVKAGLMADSVASFRGQDPLDAAGAAVDRRRPERALPRARPDAPPTARRRRPDGAGDDDAADAPDLDDALPTTTALPRVAASTRRPRARGSSSTGRRPTRRRRSP